MPNSIEIKNLQFSFQKNKSLLLNIENFQLKSGENLFLYGPSGSGKSTLLSILCGIYKPQAGSVIFGDTDITTLSAFSRDRFRGQKIGYIFQQFNLIHYLNVIENILLPNLSSRNIENPNQAAVDLATRLGLKELLYRNIFQLSVGQQQRVAVARALLGSPPFIIADEPTSALDEENKNEFISLLLKTKTKGSTVLFVSADKTLEKNFDRTAYLPELNKV